VVERAQEGMGADRSLRGDDPRNGGDGNGDECLQGMFSHYNSRRGLKRDG
jgi:hypothetical protein